LVIQHIHNAEQLRGIVRKMPAILVGPPQRNEQMWQALKTHILRERQRKKQGAYCGGLSLCSNRNILL